MKRKVCLVLFLVLILALSTACTGSNPPEPKPEPAPVQDQNRDRDQENQPSVETEEPAEEMPLAYTDISPADAKELIESMPEIIIIDVSPLYAEGHIPNAINYSVGDGSLDNAIPELDSEATYLVYCHSDSASILGAQKLVEAGFTKVYRLEGNYSAWVEAGYPVEQ